MIPAVALLVALVAVGLALALALGQARWRRDTRALRARLEATRDPGPAPAFRTADLAGLPAPVERYLRTALPAGQPAIAALRIVHAGSFDLGGATPRWRRFRSEQRTIARPPGFDWDARIAAGPALAVHVHDAYVAGEGLLLASLAGLVTLQAARGGRALALGELYRWLAESPWCPTALLPGPRLRWEGVDAQAARATLEDGPLSVAMTFHFGPEGLIERARAEGRERMAEGRSEPAPWEGRYWNYARQGGMLVPLDAEVAWILPEGPKPYLRGHIERMEFELAPVAAGAP